MLCHNLTISDGSTLTLTSPGSLVVLGNLIIQHGGTLTDNGLINLKGNLQNQNSTN
jgi:hypothetical protein